MEKLRELQKKLQECEQQVKILSQREESLSDFIENASVPLHWVDNEGTIIWANKAELDFLGYTKEEYIGRLISDFHTDQDVIADMLTRLKNGETLKNYRAKLARKDGTVKHVLVNSNALIKDGEFIHTRCFTRDITELVEEEERKSAILRALEEKNALIKVQAEELKKDREMLYISRQEIEEAELRTRLAIESAEMGTFDWDLKNLKFLNSERVIEIFGLNSKKNVTHQDLVNSFHPDDKPIRDKAITEALIKGLLQYEVRIIWPDKSIHWVKVYGKVIYNDQQEPLKMYGMVTNVTEQKKVLEELQEREAKFRLLADSMPQQIWTSDAQGNLDYFNQAVYDMSGYSYEDIRKNGWINVVHPDDRAENITKWLHSIATGEEFILEHRFKNRHGDYRWQLSRALPQKDSNGIIQRWVGTSTDIHDQKNATAALEQKVLERTLQLKESKAFLRSVLNTTKNIIASYEALYDENDNIHDFKIIYFNDEIINIIGKTPEEILGKTCSEVFPSIFSSGIFERLVRCIVTGEPDKYEAKYANGTEFIWFEASVVKLNQNSLTLTSRNITIQKNAEIQLENLNKKLAFQNELFSHAEESSRQGNYSWNLDTAESTYSDNFFKLLGYQPGEFTTLKEHFKNHIHPDDLDLVMKEIQNILESQRVNEWQFRMLTRHGEMFYVKSTGAIMTSSGERLLVGTIQDITKEKTTALQLEQTNTLLSNKNKELEHQILDEFSESFSAYKTGENFFDSLVLEIAQKTKIDFVFIGQLIQIGVEEYVIQTFSLSAGGKIVDNIQYGLPDGPCEQVIRGEVYSYPKACKKIFPKNQTLVQFEVEGYIGYPLFDSDRRPIGLIAVMHQKEISEVVYTESLIKIAARRTELELERLTNEKTLEAKNIELERQNAELASFSYIASHDLQEPLRKITTFSSRIQEKHKVDIPDEVKLYLGKIEDSATRMSKLIRDLLDYSRLINHEKLFAQTNLNSVLRNVLTDFELLIEQKRASINFTKLLVIEAIPLHMNQLFYNLLSNALKFSRENVPPVITITSRLISQDEIKNLELKAQLAYCEITVKDNGIGFEQKYDQQIFLIFQRLNQRHQYDGTGIGLALCKKIVDNHYGKIRVESTVNEGSTFHIILPISQPD